MKATGKASAIIRTIMKDKKITIPKMADNLGISSKTIYNTFYNDAKGEWTGMSYENVYRFAEALNCEIVFRDKDTGKEYKRIEE